MVSLLPGYTHIVKPGLKHTYLSLDEEGNLLIKSPEVSQAYIETLLLKKSAWIRNAQKKFHAKKGRTDKLLQKSEFYYLGEPYRLHFQEHPKRHTVLKKEKDHYILYYHRYDIELFKKKIDAFYRTEAERIIPSLVYSWAEKMELSPSSIRFRKTKRQWGSCSVKNVLSFNTMLVKVPPEIIEYVVIHELAHIRYKHHQKAFWELVARTLPDYRERITVLHTFTPA